MSIQQHPRRPVRPSDYLAVAGASSILFCGVGFVNVVGVFQSYYRSTLLKQFSDFDISWIGSAGIFLLYSLAPLAGILTDRIGPRILLVSGSLACLVSMFTLSVCKEYYQFFLSQGVLFGVGICFTTWPSVAIVSRRLPQHRGLALGLVIGGSSLGGVIWPIMMDQLLYDRGMSFGWTMRIVGFIMLPLLGFGCVVVTEPDKVYPIVPIGGTETTETAGVTASERSTDEEAAGSSTNNVQEKHPSQPPPLLKNPVFILLCSSLALGYFGLFNPFFYVSPYSFAQGNSASFSLYTIALLNAASLFGRVLPGMLADHYGHYNILALALAFSGIIGFCWTPVHTVAGLVVWSAAYGFSSGAIISLQGACAGKIATPATQGRAIGTLQGTLAVTALVGSPIGGQLVGHYGYLALSMWTGATLFLGSGVLVAARLKLDSNPWARV